MTTEAMSLVICYDGGYYQLWLSDGRTVTPRGTAFACVSDHVEKIHMLCQMNVLCGWVGEKYDAESIMGDILQLPPMTRESLLAGASETCRQVGQLSQSFCHARNEFFCPTGLLVGGYDTHGAFIAVVTPEGQVEHCKCVAAIGIGSHEATKAFSQDPLTIVDAFDEATAIAADVFSRKATVGGSMHCWVITPHRHIRLPAMHQGDCQQVHARGRETLRRFALQCSRR